MDRTAMLQAVASRDRLCDGKFFYAVKTTGIFCKPSCPSRMPRPENILCFDTGEQARAAGFRPCKRCRPDLLSFDPVRAVTDAAKAAIDRHYGDPEALDAALASLGVTRRHLTRLFEARYDMPLTSCLDAVRLDRAKELLSRGHSVTDAALAVGFDSPSAFSTFFRRRTGMTPREFTGGVRETARSCRMETPVGGLILTESDRGLTGIRFDHPGQPRPSACQKGLFLSDAAAQLSEYFGGRRQSFDLPTDLRGTPFQVRVWDTLRSIPYGEKRSYGAVAEQAGNPKAARAVGMAANKNPLLILIPCHRVVGKSGALVGYAGGIARKEYLLRLEASSAR